MAEQTTDIVERLERATGDLFQDAADEIKRLRSDLIVFCFLWAEPYARDHGLPDGHLHSVHYDILARAGARMDSFTRSNEEEEEAWIEKMYEGIDDER